MNTIPLLAVPILLVASVNIVGGQQPRDTVPRASTKGTAVISGTLVTADQAAAPIRHARVLLAFSDSTSLGRASVTDDQGRFAFTELPASQYRLSAVKEAYVNATFGAKRPNEWSGGTSIVLADGQRLTNLTFKMPRAAVITGRVIDLNGQPAARALVRVFRSSVDWRTGLRQFLGTDGAEADDRGLYRVYGLAPGDYLVSASSTDELADFQVPSAAEWHWVDALVKTPGSAPSTLAPPAGARTMAYAPVFFPGTPNQANANVLTLTASEERSGVDIHLQLVPTAKIEGELHAQDGIARAGVVIRLYRAAESGTGALAAGTTMSDLDGRFVLRGVGPGAYLILARAKSMGAPGSAPAVTWAMSNVTVAGQDQNLALNLQPGLPLGGQVTFDGTTLKSPADLSSVRITLLPASVGGSALSIPQPLASVAGVDASGHFSLTDVSPGRYRVTAGPGPGAAGWMLRSATIGGVDAVDSYVNINAGDRMDMTVTFTDRPAELRGILADATGRPAIDYFMIVFPSDERLWMPQSRRIQALRPSSDGSFRVPNLPAGDYLVSAVTDVEQYEWYDPAFLAQLKPAAIHVTLAEGDRKIQDLKLKGGSH